METKKNLHLTLPKNVKMQENELSFLIASKLYESGKISLEQALDMASGSTLDANTVKRGRGRRPAYQSGGNGVSNLPVLETDSNHLMYLDSGNKFFVRMPGHPEYQFVPEVNASNAEVVQQPGKNEFYIAPTQKWCMVDVKAKFEDQVFSLEPVRFRGMRPPRPELQFIINGKKYNGTMLTLLSSHCLIRIKPDTDYANAFPNDVKYTLNKIDIFRQVDGELPEFISEINCEDKDTDAGITITLKDYFRKEKPGTLIHFIINRIDRINFMGKVFDEKFKARELCLTVMVK